MIILPMRPAGHPESSRGMTPRRVPFRPSEVEARGAERTVQLEVPKT
jgi:hypothetical protein